MLAITVFIIFILLLSFAVAKYSFPLTTWLISLFVIIVLLRVTDIWPNWLIMVMLVPLALFSLLGFYEPLRRAIFVKPVYRMMRKMMPPMSQTEREAIEAGTVGWEGELFSGSPDWSKLFSISAPQLSDEERLFLNEKVDQFCSITNSWKTANQKDLTEAQWQFIKENRFFGLVIPKNYGGLGFSEDAHAAVITKIASHCVVSAVTVMVPNSLGPAKLLLYYGTQPQRDYYLPRLATGEEIPCFALTGPFAGSDAGAIPDRGILCQRMFEGKETLGFRVTLDKRYITLAPIATLIGLAFKAYDPDHLLPDYLKANQLPESKDTTDLGVTCALLPSTTDGLEIGNRLNPMNNHFHNGTIRGTDVFVPIEWVIGGANNIGKGWKMLMECLSIGRGISLPGLSNASGKKTTLVTGAYGRVRKQFNQPIAYFDGVSEQLADLAKYAYIMDASCKLITGSLRDGQKPAILSSMVKYYNTERCRDVVNIAMDIHGGKGIISGPNNYLAQNYMSLPIAITVEGANILTRSLMIFGQGALRSHPFLQNEMAALFHPSQEEGITLFDLLLQKHIAYTIKNKARAFIYGFSGGLFAPKSGETIDKEIESYVKKINQISAGLAFTSDASFLILGGALKRQECVTGHFSDVWTAITMASAVLKKYQDEGAHKEDLPLVRFACDDLLHQADVALHQLLDNYPRPFLGRLLKLAVLPWGSKHRAASDRLRLEVTRLLTTDSATLKRLTDGVYLSHDQKDPIVSLLATRDRMDEFDQIEKQLKQAGESYEPNETVNEWLDRMVKAQNITQLQATRYKEILVAIKSVIDVDEFSPEDY